jgi:hypothetical protein
MTRHLGRAYVLLSLVMTVLYLSVPTAAPL